MQPWHDRDAQASAQAPLIVWLPGAARPDVATPPAMPAQRPLRSATPVLPLPAMAPAGPRAITLPAPAPEPAPVPAESPFSAPTPAPAAPLNLALPGAARGASAPWRDPKFEGNPALDDTHSNNPTPTLESRIAAALGGSDQITEHRLEDGSVRLKRGSSCVVVRPNRASALDPFNASARARPRLLDRC